MTMAHFEALEAEVVAAVAMKVLERNSNAKFHYMEKGHFNVNTYLVTSSTLANHHQQAGRECYHQALGQCR